MSNDPKRRELAVVRPERQLRVLEAVRHVADEYGLAVGSLKPCIAFLLDGNIGGAERHEAAFTLAMECRRLQLSESETSRILAKWAKKIGYSSREARDPIKAAYAKTADGKHWRYYPPGLHKRAGSQYDRVLGDICHDAGCPQNCAPFKDLSRGPRGQDMNRFDRLGWPLVLRKERHAAAADYYRAVYLIERRHGLAAGATILTSYADLSALAGRAKSHAGENLRILYTMGLLTTFQRGSGSGPKAHDRRPSQVARAVPIPNIPPRYRAAISTGDETASEIGAARTPRIGADTASHIGDLGDEP